MKNLLLAAAVILVTSVARGAEPATTPSTMPSTVAQGTLEKQTRRINAALPAGWSASSSDGAIISIERQQEAAFCNTTPNPPPDEGAVMRKPSLTLFVRPAMTTAELDARKTSNRNRQKALDLLATHLTDLTMVTPVGDNDGYAAKTPDQQERLDAYKAVYDGLPQYVIPDLFADDIALEWSDSNWSADDARVSAEIQRVAKIVDALYSKTPLH